MSFLSDFETQIGAAFDLTSGPIATASQSLFSIFKPAFLVGMTIWVLMIGYEVAYGKSEDGLTYLLSKVGKVFFIGCIAFFGWPFVGDLVDATRQGFVASLGSGAGTISSTVETNITAPLGTIYASLLTSTGNFFSVFSGLKFWDIGERAIDFLLSWLGFGAVWLVAMVLAGVTVVMYMVAFATFSLVYLVGPLFLLCFAFPFTQRFFETWVGAAITASLAMGFTAFLAVATATLLGLTATANAVGPTPSIAGGSFALTVLSKAGYAGLLMYLYFKVFDLAASLAGGLNLGNNIAGYARNVLRDLLNSSAGSRAGSGSRGAGVNNISSGRGRGGGSPEVRSRGGVLEAMSRNRTLTGAALTGVAGVGFAAAGTTRFAYRLGASALRRASDRLGPTRSSGSSLLR